LRQWAGAAALSWIFMGVCNFFAKVASDRLPVSSVAVWWSVGYVPLTAVLLAVVGWPRDFDRRSAFCSFSAGVVGQLAALAFYLALAGGLVSVVSTLASLYPVVTIVLAMLCLKERVNLRQGAGVGLAIAAIALLSG
jgi:transporter family protein